MVHCTEKTDIVDRKGTEVTAKSAFSSAVLCLGLVASLAAGAVEPAFHWGLQGEVASGYLSSGGTLGDTRPVTTQRATWRYDYGEYGAISGYVWTKSSFHNRQHEAHRAAFDQFETAIYYGRDWTLPRDMALRSKFGPLWNPLVGYKDGHNCDWGVHFVQSLENDFVVPYMNGLWMVAPSPRSRIRFGLQRSFSLSGGWTVLPFVETVWMDNRRFQSRYGGIPQDRFLGGAFATMTTGVRVTWQMDDNWRLFVRLRQYDIINSQSRRAIKRQTAYYAKCDYPVVGIGVECSF